MASNKNQHFVPRCYLKQFTINAEGAGINVYNIDRRVLISKAPVKNQCSGNYFYGQDAKLEAAIQSLEQGYSSALKDILRPGYRLQSRHEEILQFFWLFQYLRTEGACRRSAEMFADMFDSVNFDGSFSMSIKEAVLASMHAFAEDMHSMSDMKVCLLRNASEIPFITSDDPAILTNRWKLEDKRTKGSALGLRDAGAIMLLPLSPKIYCIGYDSAVYKIPNEGGWLAVRKSSDVESLNEFQLMNCRANLFVGNEDLANYLHRFVDMFIHRRPAERHVVNFAIFEGEGDEEFKRYRVVSKAEFAKAEDGLMHAKSISTHPSSWPSFLLRRSKSSAYYNGTGLGYIRQMHAELKGGDIPFFKVKPYR